MIDRRPEQTELHTSSLDEQYVEVLKRFDEDLRRGGPGSTDGAGPSADTPVAPEGLRDCLLLLERAWPRAGDSPASAQDRIGRFLIERLLGQGGFGVVYLATDPELNRQVALKVPRLHALASPGLRERFRREARAAAGLDHPNIVPVFEAGEVEGGCYIASAYCPGSNLAEWLKDQPGGVRPETAALITARLSEAVAYSHSRGVLHRDIKPSNVMLVPSWAGDSNPPDAHTALAAGELPFVPKLGDFGLAKVMWDALADGTIDVMPETAASSVLGTPAYMAPEQTGGRADDVGPAADVYALGVVLYELLTGRPPFQGPSVVDVLDQVLHAEPVPVRRLRRDLSRDLETVCHKCLEKDPGRRYETAGALAADLSRVLNHEPIVARPPSAVYRLKKFARRNRTITLLLSLLIITLLAGTGFSTAFAIQARNALEVEREAQAKYEREHALAKQNLTNAADTVHRLLTRVAQEQLFTTPGGTQLRRELLIEAGEQLEALSNGQRDPQLLLRSAAAYREIGTIHHHCGDFSNAAAALNRGMELLASLPESSEYCDPALTEQAHLRTVLGEVYWYQGRHQEALAELNLAIASAETLCAKHLSAPQYLGLLEYPVGLRGLVKFSNAIGDEGQQDFERALALAREVLAERSERDDLHETELNRLRIATNQVYLAGCRSQRGETEAALDMYDEALALMERIDVALDPNRAVANAPDQTEVARSPLPAQLQVRWNKSVALLAKGRCLLSLGEQAGAHACFTEAVAVLEPIAREFPEILWSRSQLASAYANLARSLAAQGQLVNAAACQRKAIEAQPNDLRTAHRYNAACFASLASASADTTAEPLNDTDRAAWRTQARDWLTADLSAWQALADSTSDFRPQVALAHWQTDPDLAPVRDPEPLARLPETEQQQWNEFWRRVEELRGSLAAATENGQ